MRLMRKYPQLSILRPIATLLVWFAIMGMATVCITVWPGIEFEPPLSHAVGERWFSEMTLLGGVSALGLTVIAGVVFRNLQSVVLTLLVGMFSISVSCGIMSLAGIPITMPMSTLFVLMAVLSTTYAIHVGYSYIHQSVHELAKGRTIRDRKFMLSDGVRSVFTTVLIAGITTGIGFLALVVSSVPDIENMGLFMAIGTAISVAAALTVVPAVIALWPWHVRHEVETTRILHRVVDRLGSAAALHPRHTFAGFALALAVGMVGLLRVDLDTGGMPTPSLFTLLSIAAAASWLLFSALLRSLRLGTLVLMLKAVPLVMLYAVVGFSNHPLDPLTAIVGVIMLGITVGDTVHLVRLWKRFVTFERLDPSEASRRAIRMVGKPVVVAAAARTLALSVLLLADQAAVVWLGVIVVAVSASALLCDLLLAPAMLAVTRHRFPWPTDEQLASAAPMENIIMDPKRTKLSDYSHEELEAMHVYDFFSLCGKIVIRVGGLFGTRRLLYEMNIPPGSKVLEIGSGRGATAFTLAKLYDCHVVCTDLSEYMISQARQCAEIFGVADKVEFVVGKDASRLAFDDNSFDIVLAEAVAMYTTTDVIFKEAYRVLKPGGIFGSHEWSWSDESVTGLRGLVGNIACSSDMYCVNMYTNTGWHDELHRFNFDVEFNEQYPFALTSPMGMFDDEGVWPILKMFGRVGMHPKAMGKMLRVMAFLDKYAHAFTYTLSVNRKPLSAPAVEEPDADSAE